MYADKDKEISKEKLSEQEKIFFFLARKMRKQDFSGATTPLYLRIT